MKIAFRVDSSNIIGSGHLIRSINLAKSFSANSIECIFFSKNLYGNLNELITDAGFELSIIDSKVDMNKIQTDNHLSWIGGCEKEDANVSLKKAKKLKIDLIIVDHYSLSFEWEQTFQNNNIKVFVIDDFFDRKHACNYYLNQNIGVTSQNNFLSSETIIFQGPKYALLSDKYMNLRKDLNKEYVNLRILVNFGGMDKTNLTCKLIDCLEACNNIKKADIHVVLGPGFIHKKEVLARKTETSFDFVIHHNPENFPELIAWSNLFIGGCGSTSWERCCLSTPSLAISQSENQNNILEELAKVGAVKEITFPFSSREIDNQISNLTVLNFKSLKIMSKISSKICDGNGCSRIVDYIRKDLNA